MSPLNESGFILDIKFISDQMISWFETEMIEHFESSPIDAVSGAVKHLINGVVYVVEHLEKYLLYLQVTKDETK